MLPLREVIFFSSLVCFISGALLPKDISKNGNESGEKPELNPKVCASGDSHVSKNDIKVIIDHFYKQNSLEDVVTKSYQLQASAIRDKHIQDLKNFNAWFENQPEHLKQVLTRLSQLRQQIVEPHVEKVAAVLKEYPKLEQVYIEKRNKLNEVQLKLNKYKFICQHTCEDSIIPIHNVTKRNAPADDFYCGSIKDLTNKVNKKLSEYVEKIKSDTNTKLAENDKKYGQKVNEIKSKLKDKALKEFGRTMYDVLNLEDEYHHFALDLTVENLDESIYSIQNLGFQVDIKILELEKAVEKYGQYCKTCISASFKRSKRSASIQSEAAQKESSEDVLNGMLEEKFNVIFSEVESNMASIFNELDVLLQKSDTEEVYNLKPIQKEIQEMTHSEIEVLNKLKLGAPKSLKDDLLKLIKMLQDILNIVYTIIKNLPIP